MPSGRGRINRFVVMAMLQATRAEALGLPKPSAYSWGLNRAIFYAAAKRGFRGGAGSGAPGEGEHRDRPEPSPVMFRLGDDEAIRAGTSEPVQFIIGDKPQTPDEFARQITARFGSPAHFGSAWEEAARIVSGFDRAVLASRSQFYGEVYKPRRDELSQAWDAKYGSPAPPPGPGAALPAGDGRGTRRRLPRSP